MTRSIHDTLDRLSESQPLQLYYNPRGVKNELPVIIKPLDDISSVSELKMIVKDPRFTKIIKSRKRGKKKIKKTQLPFYHDVGETLLAYKREQQNLILTGPLAIYFFLPIPSGLNSSHFAIARMVLLVSTYTARTFSCQIIVKIGGGRNYS